MQTHYKNPAIQKAFHVLERLSTDDETRYLAQKRDEALKFEIIALAAAEKEGRAEGRAEGEIIGEIRMAQRVLNQPVNSVEELSQKSFEELHTLLQELEAQVLLQPATKQE